MSYQDRKERERRRSKSRSRNKTSKRRGSSQSPSSSHINKDRHNNTQGKKRRVRFVVDEQLFNIRYFRKQDEPNFRPLTQKDLLEMKVVATNNPYLSMEEIKHKESLMEGQSMKLFKEKEKTLNDKIFSVKEQINYYVPIFLKTKTLVEGQQSTQKQQHNNRIASTLGCFYTKMNEIPDSPSMNSVLNNYESQLPPKSIAFEKPTEKDQLQILKFVKPEQKKKQISIKGILKRGPEEIKKIRQKQILEKRKADLQSSNYIDPEFIQIFRDISSNRGKYTPQQISVLLKPFKQNGTLEGYLKKITVKQQSKPLSMPDPQKALMILDELNKRYKPLPPIQTYLTNINNLATESKPTDFHNRMFPPQINLLANIPMMPMTMFNPHNKLQKFRTVPCKYYHSMVGCQRKDDCTFIHDEAFAGRPTPNMNRFARPGTGMGMGMQPPLFNNNTNNNNFMFNPPFMNHGNNFMPPPNFAGGFNGSEEHMKQPNNQQQAYSFNPPKYM